MTVEPKKHVFAQPNEQMTPEVQAAIARLRSPFASAYDSGDAQADGVLVAAALDEALDMIWFELT